MASQREDEDRSNLSSGAYAEGVFFDKTVSGITLGDCEAAHGDEHAKIFSFPLEPELEFSSLPFG